MDSLFVFTLISGVTRGPYPAVWAMLVMHHHPANKGLKAPKMIYNHQTVYERTKVDAKSIWGLDWEAVGEAHLVSDLQCAGLREATCAIQCEEGDLLIDCAWCPPRAICFH